MIAVDTSSLVAYLEGQAGEDVEALALGLTAGVVVLPPVVLTEILSDRKLPIEICRFLRGIPLIQLQPGYWARAGQTRAKVLSKNYKARIADSLIAQACIDSLLPLITRDRDFKHFVPYDLKLYTGVS